MSTVASRSGTVAAPDASPTDSHERIVQVARRLFGERENREDRLEPSGSHADEPD